MYPPTHTHHHHHHHHHHTHTHTPPRLLPLSVSLCRVKDCRRHPQARVFPRAATGSGGDASVGRTHSPTCCRRRYGALRLAQPELCGSLLNARACCRWVEPISCAMHAPANTCNCVSDRFLSSLPSSSYLFAAQVTASIRLCCGARMVHAALAHQTVASSEEKQESPRASRRHATCGRRHRRQPSES